MTMTRCFDLIAYFEKNRVNIHELGQPASRSDTNTIEETDRETPLQTAV